MHVFEVNNKVKAKEFLNVPQLLYRHDPNWIRPLDRDINNIFDPGKNKFFKHGSACRWIIKNATGQLIGRVAAFINERTAFEEEQPTGSMGFFECIDDQGSADLLFETCRAWLAEHGMEAMEGPVNFGERNMWWGLLAEGFTEPSYGMTYNHGYYRNLFENYGFQVYYKQLTYGLDIYNPKPVSYEEKAANILNDPAYRVEFINKKKLPAYARDFMIIFNSAWGNHPGFKNMKEEQALKLMKSMKPVLVEDLMWFVYHKDEPVAFFIMLPELNQYFKHVNGKMNLVGKVKFLWHKWRKNVRKMQGVVFGVVPEHQGKGIEGAIVISARNRLLPQKRWDYMELAWIGDFNPKMHTIAENLGAEVVKTHHTYRYLFDREKEFKRHPVL